MNDKHKRKIQARNKQEARQARRVINGIFVGLIVLMVIFLVVSNYCFS